MHNFFKKNLLILSFVSAIFSPNSISSANQEDIWTQIYQKSKDAVVQIFSFHKNYNWEKPYQDGVEYQTRGTGFFIDKKGHMATNFHVVNQAEVIYIQIPCLGKEKFEVEIVGCYPEKDFAVLKLLKKSHKLLLENLKETTGYTKIPSLELGNSNNILGAQKIILLGYPLGMDILKISSGDIAGPQHIDGQHFIQTTAPVNPGNSGGPFFGSDGKVIGIATSFIKEAENVGYFIPISNIKKLIQGIIDNRYQTKLLRKSFWGCEIHVTTEDTLQALGCPTDGGARVKKVVPNSFANTNGLLEGDIIYMVKVNEKETKIDRYGYVNVAWCQEKIPFSDMIERLDFGEEFSLIVYRKLQDNKTERITINCHVEMGNYFPIYKKYPHFEKVDYKVIDGMTVMELTENHLEILKTEIKNTVLRRGILSLPSALKYEKYENREKPRLYITHIAAGSAIKNTYCISEGDILSKINDIPVETLQDLEYALEVAQETEMLTILTEDGEFAAIPWEKIENNQEFNLELRATA